MKYYIKTIGINNKPISVYKGRFPRMLLDYMCFQTDQGIVRKLKKGDKLVIYCLQNGVIEFPGGGFIGVQDVLGAVTPDKKRLFRKGWDYIVKIEPRIFSFTKRITLNKVRHWEGKSQMLNNALAANLEAIGGLWKIEKNDYSKFWEKFIKTR